MERFSNWGLFTIAFKLFEMILASGMFEASSIQRQTGRIRVVEVPFTSLPQPTRALASWGVATS